MLAATSVLAIPVVKSAALDRLSDQLDTVLPNPGAILTQEYLMAVTQYRDIAEFGYRLPDVKADDLHTYTVYVHARRLNGDQFSQSKYDGKLLAICDSGIFIYKHQKRKVRYYPFRVVWTLNKGVSSSKVFTNFTLGGAGAGMVVGAVASLDPSSGVQGGLALGAFYGMTASVYYILGRSLFKGKNKEKSCRVFAKTSNGIAFREKNLKSGKYIPRIDIATFPHGDSVGLPQLANNRVVTELKDNSIVANRVPVNVVKHTEVKDSTPLDTLPQPIEKEAVKTETAVTANPLETKVPAPVVENKRNQGDFKSEKGLIPTWMFADFKAAEVRTSYLSSQFSWIRQRQITPADLKKLKSASEIQFLAMWLTTAAGYSFRELVPFSKEQLAFIQPKEPYLAETVTANLVFDPMVFLDLDIENLKVLYEALSDLP